MTNSNTVLLVNPPLKARFNGAPMNLVAIGTYLESRGIECGIIDLCLAAAPLDALLSGVEKLQPSVVAFGSYSPSHRSALSLARELKARHPEILIVKGGIHETFLPDTTIRNHGSIDVTVRGDGEEALHGLMTARQGAALERVPGITYRKNGSIHCNPMTPRSPGRSLDDNPLPNRRLLERSQYYDFPIFGSKRTAQVITTRGCPFPCTFCSASSSTDDGNSKYRWRGEASVEAEIRQLIEEGYGAVFFDDSVFTVNQRRSARIAEIMLGSGLEWACQTRVDCVNPELLANMKRSGCSYLFYGFEAADDRQLASMAKGVTADQCWKAVDLAVQTGMRVGVSLIVGHPGETDLQLMTTFERLAAYDPSLVSVSLSMYALYPGTRDWHAAVRDGLIDPSCYERDHSSEDIWYSFDEGVGSVHLATPDRAHQIMSMAAGVLDSNRLFIDLPQAA